jgi:iron complex transport system substrate-binding protein
VLHKVDQVARVLKLDDQGAQLRQQIRRQSEAALARIADQTGPATLFILGAGNRGLMAAGKHTQAQALLDVLAVDNVIDYQGYKPLSVEGALLANPAVVLVAYTGPADHQAFSESLALTDAGKNGRIYAVDTSSVLGFGPRIGSALTQLVDMLYPSSQPQPLAGAE